MSEIGGQQTELILAWTDTTGRGDAQQVADEFAEYHWRERRTATAIQDGRFQITDGFRWYVIRQEGTAWKIYREAN